MKDYKYRYLYIVLTERSSLTNGLPGIYIGQHSTDYLDDGYIGSGKLLKKYLQKHPNKFERHILSYYNSKEELDKAEYEMIHDILGYTNVLNLIEGGNGGGNFINIYKNNPDFNKGENNSMYGKNPRDYMNPDKVKAMNEHQSEIMKGSNNPMYGKGDKISGEKNGMYGKSIKDFMTEENFEDFREKQRIIRSERNKRSKWMTNGIHRVFPTEDKFQKYLDMGYHFGQK